MAFIWSRTTFRNIMMKMGVGRRERTPTPYRRYTDTEVYDVNAQTVITTLPATFTALPATRNSDNREIAFLYVVSPEMLCLLM